MPHPTFASDHMPAPSGLRAAAAAALAPHLGLRFRELMSGTVRGPGGGGERFAFDLDLVIPSLAAFLAADHHVASVGGGVVHWQGVGTPVDAGGSVELFRNVTPDRKHKQFDFRFSGVLGGVGAVVAEATKDLRDDPGLDPLADLTHVDLTVRGAGGWTRAGRLSVHLLEFVRQVRSIEVTGRPEPSAAEVAATRAAFLAFMNRQLRDIYRNMPLLFPDDAGLSLEEREMLAFAIRLFLPDPLPASGPQLGDVTDEMERFVRHASASQIEQLRTVLGLAGTALRLVKEDVSKARAWVRQRLAGPNGGPDALRSALDQLHGLAVAPYYSHPRVDALVGYQRPAQRRSTPVLPVVHAAPGQVFDVVIAGSGPAGSLLAERLSSGGRSVLLVEAGPYVPEHDIGSGELMAIARLYKRSGFQFANENSRDGSAPPFRVLQGSCLGGGGVVNNAVCLMLPGPTFARWREAGFPYTREELRGAYDRVRQELGIQLLSAAMKQGAEGRRNPADRFLVAALGPLLQPPASWDFTPGLYECPVNLDACEGTGLCNVGCPVGAKQNGLQYYLSRAVTTGNCTLLVGAEVLEAQTRDVAGALEVTGLRVRTADGRTATVQGRRYVLSCGPIGSTAVLLASDRIAALHRQALVPVGRRFGVNFGSPVFAFCDSVQHQQPSVQIAHFWVPPSAEQAFVLETWYNPPAANAVAIPGYMDVHHSRMLRYASTVAAAPLVGSRPVGTISRSGGRLRVDLPVGAYELGGLRRGLTRLAGAFVAGGVQSILVALDTGMEARTMAELAQVDAALGALEADPSQAWRLRFGTGHPQGGNAISDNDTIGVVGRDFRVRGTSNLHVCDGSVFPDTAGVNPQWTIMALADLCAAAVLREGT